MRFEENYFKKSEKKSPKKRLSNVLIYIGGIFFYMDTRKASAEINRITAKYKKNILRSLTVIAYETMQAVRKEIPKVYKTPTPFTVRSARYEKAKKINENTVKAAVYINNNVSKGTPQSVYLKGSIQQKKGVKPSEIKIQNKIGLNKRLVPAKNVKKNKYGNVALARYSKIIDAIKIGHYNKNARENYFYRKIKTVGLAGGIIYKTTSYKIKKDKIEAQFLVLDQIEKPRKIFKFDKFVENEVAKIKDKIFKNVLSVRK